MTRLCFVFLFFILLTTGCGNRHGTNAHPMTSIQLIDRNGFKETISAHERLKYYENTDFLTSQPYSKIIRNFARNSQGKTPSRLTTYHDNGQLWQYLDVVNGRSCGSYREWHENGTLHVELTVIEGLGDLSEEAQLGWVFDGRSRAWDSQGHLLAEIYYEKGKLQGNAFYYHENGKIRQVSPYEEGYIDGDLVYYNQTGEVIGKTPYKQGKRDGIATFKGDSKKPAYSEEYRDDFLLEATYHDFSGTIVSRINKGNGVQALFDLGKLQKMREYVDGVPQGEVKLFNEKGQLQSLFHMTDGVKHGGEWIYYLSLFEGSLQPKLYIHWCEGVAQGMTRTWYSNGVLESEREISDNKKQGVSSAWYKDGSLMMIEEYENDELYRGTYMKKGESHPVSSVEDGEGTATFYDANGFFLKRVPYSKGRPIHDI